MALPLLAQRFLSSREYLWTTEFHYSAPIYVILFFATVDALLNRSFIREKLRKSLSAGLVLMMFLVPAADLVFSRPINFPFFRFAYHAWERTPHMKHQQQVVDWIPAATCVAADDRIAVHLTSTNRVTLPTLSKKTNDFVILDMTQREVGYPLPSPQVVRDEIMRLGYFEVYSAGEIVVWQRPGYSGPRPGCEPTAG